MGQVCKKCSKTNENAHVHKSAASPDHVLNSEPKYEDDLQNHNKDDGLAAVKHTPVTGARNDPLRGSHNISVSNDVRLGIQINNPDGLNPQSQYSVPDENPILYKNVGTYIGRREGVPNLSSDPYSQALAYPINNTNYQNEVTDNYGGWPDVKDKNNEYDEIKHEYYDDFRDDYKPADYNADNYYQQPQHATPISGPLTTSLKPYLSGGEENMYFAAERLSRKQTSTGHAGMSQRWLSVVQVSQFPGNARPEDHDRYVARLGSNEEEQVRYELAKQMREEPRDKADNRKETQRDAMIAINVELPENNLVEYFEALDSLVSALERISPQFIVASTIVGRGAGRVFLGRSQMANLSKPDDLSNKNLVDKIRKEVTAY